MTTATTTLKQALLVSMLCLAVLASSNRVLVLVDDLAQIDTFSIYFDSLRESGFDLKFALPDDPQTHLVDVGDFTCDKLIVFSPETDDFANFNKDKILSFIDRGNDVLIAASPDTASSVANLIADNGAIPLRDSTIIDHLNFDATDPEGDHSTIIAKDFTEFASSFLGAEKINPILYRGTGLLVRDDNPLIAPILRASSTAYARSGHAKEIPAAGSKIALLASLQARNNARVTISGSLSLFSNQFITQKIDVDGKPTKTGNFDLATKITQWTFQQTKVLRLSNVKHHLVGQTEQQDTYTIREFVEYSFDVEQWDGKKWSPFNANDFQLEFQMIDPYVRSTLVNDGKGHHSTQFQVPDVYGIFTFKLTYSRPGYSYLQDRTNVIVRPLRHDQYERFIPIAFPYYAASFSMMLGVVLFSFIFLFTRD